MIGLIFIFGTEIIEVRIDGNNILFRNNQTNGMFGTIDNLKLDKNGVIKEFPDLKDSNDWETIARNRFKEKIKAMNTEQEKTDYIINDLKKFGYKAIAKQRSGFRMEKLNGK